MASKQVFELEGWDEMLREVERLPDRMKRNELLKIMRRVAKPTVRAAKANVSSISGRLERSIGSITGRSKKYPNVQVGPRAKGKNEGFHGHLVEFGHGGPNPAPAHPFMRPAYDQTKGMVTQDAARQVAKYLQKRANQLKNGI